MKKDIHPDYKEVVFQDVQSDFKFLTRSTLKSEEKIKNSLVRQDQIEIAEKKNATHSFKKLYTISK